MSNPEFKKEFQEKYNSASYGAPDLNNYEISLWLTQAIRDVVLELYKTFEYSEFSKRGLNPLIKEQELTLSNASDYYGDVVAQEATLPSDIYFILQENAILNNGCGDIDVMSEDLDNLNNTMKNPFRKPNKRKVIRTQIGDNNIRLYSDGGLTKFKIKYIKKYTPIILSDFTTDPDLLGSETIDGLATESNTELPVFLHDRLVDRAVILAIKSLRENNLKTQIEV